ncbi:hypothetical protein KP509_04G084500 [Ceratopteris richardii]|uniref:Uncharacterized protein n=1 Tax=Ceratopteris richardii TaxID=49495 RepID=A0A8T2UUR9_CERRI|nr:hypothetical protein KP509_04G084500 [Ceratopteris richardii]
MNSTSIAIPSLSEGGVRATRRQFSNQEASTSSKLRKSASAAASKHAIRTVQGSSRFSSQYSKHKEQNKADSDSLRLRKHGELMPQLEEENKAILQGLETLRNPQILEDAVENKVETLRDDRLVEENQAHPGNIEDEEHPAPDWEGLNKEQGDCDETIIDNVKDIEASMFRKESRDLTNVLPEEISGVESLQPEANAKGKEIIIGNLAGPSQTDFSISSATGMKPLIQKSSDPQIPHLSTFDCPETCESSEQGELRDDDLLHRRQDNLLFRKHFDSEQEGFLFPKGEDLEKELAQTSESLTIEDVSTNMKQEDEDFSTLTEVDEPLKEGSHYSPTSATSSRDDDRRTWTKLILGFLESAEIAMEKHVYSFKLLDLQHDLRGNRNFLPKPACKLFVRIFLTAVLISALGILLCHFFLGVLEDDRVYLHPT